MNFCSITWKRNLIKGKDSSVWKGLNLSREKRLEELKATIQSKSEEQAYYGDKSCMNSKKYSLSIKCHLKCLISLSWFLHFLLWLFLWWLRGTCLAVVFAHQLGMVAGSRTGFSCSIDTYLAYWMSHILLYWDPASKVLRTVLGFSR